MSRKLLGGLAATLLLGVIGFIGLYVAIARLSARGLSGSHEDAVEIAAPAPLAETGTAAPEEGAGEAAAAAAPSAGHDDHEGHGHAEEAPTPAAAAAPEEIDLSLDEPTLEKFLEVRRRMYEVYEPVERELLVMEEDMAEYRRRSKDALQRAAHLLPIHAARAEGLVATGLSEAEYERIARVVYEYWWRATAAGVDIEVEASRARRELAEVEEKMAAVQNRPNLKHRLGARKVSLEREIGRLEWARSYSARQLLAKIPAATRRVCEKHAGEIDGRALKALDLLTF